MNAPEYNFCSQSVPGWLFVTWDDGDLKVYWIDPGGWRLVSGHFTCKSVWVGSILNLSKLVSIQNCKQKSSNLIYMEYRICSRINCWLRYVPHLVILAMTRDHWWEQLATLQNTQSRGPWLSRRQQDNDRCFLRCCIGVLLVSVTSAKHLGFKKFETHDRGHEINKLNLTQKLTSSLQENVGPRNFVGAVCIFAPQCTKKHTHKIW